MIKYLCLPITLLLSSCVGPDYQRPDFPVPKKWKNDLGAQSQGRHGNQGSQAVDAAWWQKFNDPQLNALIDEAVESNLDYAVALARIREARANYSEVESNLFPTFNGVGSAGRSFTGANVPRTSISLGSGGSSGSGQQLGNRTLYKAGFDASWELDFFGAIVRGEESAKALLESVEENANAVLVSLIAEVAQNYILLRNGQKQLEIREDIAKLAQENRKLQESLEKTGLVDQISTSTAKSALEQALAEIPPLQATIKAAVHRIGVLLGKDPGALYGRLLKKGQGIPYMNEAVIAGIPSEVLRRRPDIMAAERLLASATAQIGVSIAGLFPHFQLTGSYLFERNQPRNMFSPASQLWNYALNFSVPIFDFGKIQAQIEAKYAQKDEAFLLYKKSILTAFEEVENGLINYAKETQRFQNLKQKWKIEAQIRHLTELRQKAGIGNYMDVIQARITELNAQVLSEQSKATVSLDLVVLNKALGGGWNTSEEKYPVNSKPSTCS